MEWVVSPRKDEVDSQRWEGDSRMKGVVSRTGTAGCSQPSEG